MADRTSIDDKRCLGRPVTVPMVELQNKIDTFVQSIQKMCVSDIVDTLSTSFGTAQFIMTKKLKYEKICVYQIILVK